LNYDLKIRTSIIIPAYNEASRLASGYERLHPILEELNPDDTEVIVVDDGSSDDTMHAANDLYGALPHTQFIHQPVNLGKGAAVRLGIAVAHGEKLIAADATLLRSWPHWTTPSWHPDRAWIAGTLTTTHRFARGPARCSAASRAITAARRYATPSVAARASSEDRHACWDCSA
jgi:hypothetical protein